MLALSMSFMFWVGQHGLGQSELFVMAPVFLSRFSFLSAAITPRPENVFSFGDLASDCPDCGVRKVLSLVKGTT